MMLPVRLERKSVRSGFKLRLHEDEARFNPTLLQMLKRDFALDMPDVEREFASSLDVSATWRAVRQHVRHVQGFEVSERVVLSTLSFTKYLMWKDLVDRTEDLKRNPVVRHLIDTPTHVYRGGGGDFIDPRDIDLVKDPGLVPPLGQYPAIFDPPHQLSAVEPLHLAQQIVERDHATGIPCRGSKGCCCAHFSRNAASSESEVCPISTLSVTISSPGGFF